MFSYPCEYERIDFRNIKEQFSREYHVNITWFEMGNLHTKTKLKRSIEVTYYRKGFCVFERFSIVNILPVKPKWIYHYDFIIIIAIWYPHCSLTHPLLGPFCYTAQELPRDKRSGLVFLQETFTRHICVVGDCKCRLYSSL